MGRTNTNGMSILSLRGVPRFAGRQSNLTKNEIATPFGLAMTTPGAKIFNAFPQIKRKQAGVLLALTSILFLPNIPVFHFSIIPLGGL